MADENMLSGANNSAYLSHQRVEQYFKSLSTDGYAKGVYPTLTAAQKGGGTTAKGANGEKVFFFSIFNVCIITIIISACWQHDESRQIGTDLGVAYGKTNAAAAAANDDGPECNVATSSRPTSSYGFGSGRYRQ